MITPAFGLTATERVLPRLALDFTTASLDPRITFTRTTGASNPATYIDSSGVITAATNNQPRFDHDPVTLICKGLLIEESRTNSLLNTDLLSTQIVTVTAAVRTLSFYGTGSVTLSGAHAAVVSGTGAYPTRTTYSFTPTAGALTLTVTGTVQFAQLEAGAFATSYIPTTTAALTRNADVATMTGTNFSDWYNQSAGTLAATAIPVNNIAGTTARIFVEAGNATGTERFAVEVRSSTLVRARTVTGGVTVTGADATYNALGISSTIVGALGTAEVSMSVAGIATNTVASNIPSPDTLYLGTNYISSVAATLNGHLQEIKYWPFRLTNSEIQAFSK